MVTQPFAKFTLNLHKILGGPPKNGKIQYKNKTLGTMTKNFQVYCIKGVTIGVCFVCRVVCHVVVRVRVVVVVVVLLFDNTQVKQKQHKFCLVL